MDDIRDVERLRSELEKRRRRYDKLSHESVEASFAGIATRDLYELCRRNGDSWAIQTEFFRHVLRLKHELERYQRVLPGVDELEHFSPVDWLSMRQLAELLQQLAGQMLALERHQVIEAEEASAS